MSSSNVIVLMDLTREIKLNRSSKVVVVLAVAIGVCLAWFFNKMPLPQVLLIVGVLSFAIAFVTKSFLNFLLTIIGVVGGAILALIVPIIYALAVGLIDFSLRSK